MREYLEDNIDDYPKILEEIKKIVDETGRGVMGDTDSDRLKVLLQKITPDPGPEGRGIRASDFG